MATVDRKPRIVGITAHDRLEIYDLVYRAMRYYPNDGGDETPRDHIRSVFRSIRVRMVDWRWTLQMAIGDIDRHIYAMEDM
jgi:hypothetical protein